MTQRKPILDVGRNVWRVARASQAAILIDGCNYFSPLERALRAAEHSVLIIGWDFDGGIKLCPDNEDCRPLDEFLRSLVEEKSNLEIHILI